MEPVGCDASAKMEVGSTAAVLPKFKLIVLEGVKDRLGGFVDVPDTVIDCWNAGTDVALLAEGALRVWPLLNTDKGTFVP